MLAVAYAIWALSVGWFVRERMYDTQADDMPVVSTG